MQNIDSAYVFFKCLYQLGLFQFRIGLTRQIDLFLYNWIANAKRNKSKKGKRSRRSLSTQSHETTTRK